MTNGKMTNPWFEMHVICYICKRPIDDAINFTNYFNGGITQG